MEHNKPLTQLLPWKAHHCKVCQYRHYRISMLVPLAGSTLPTRGEELKNYRIDEAARLCGWHEILALERIQAVVSWE